jgi:hypothetical protein
MQSPAGSIPWWVFAVMYGVGIPLLAILLPDFRKFLLSVGRGGLLLMGKILAWLLSLLTALLVLFCLVKFIKWAWYF